MPHKFIDITGQRFGRLLALRRIKYAQWEFLCDCGTIKTTCGRSVRRGGTVSCGCNKIEKHKQRLFKHGLSKTPEWKAWHGMMDRCYNEQNPGYRNYGGRGISVCERWGVVENFISDIGNRPTSKHSIDRINNNGPYSPENCRWATRSEQNSNYRLNHWLTLKGKTMIIKDWATKLGLPRSVIDGRLQRNWSVEETLTIPMRKNKRRNNKMENSKFLDAFKAMNTECGDLYNLVGDTLLVEDMGQEEATKDVTRADGSKVQLVLSGGDVKKVDGLDMNLPKFVRVLAVGAGYYDENRDPVNLDVEIGDIVLIGRMSVNWFSIFGGLVSTGKAQVGLTRESEIKMRFKGGEGYAKCVEVLNRAVTPTSIAA